MSAGDMALCAFLAILVAVVAVGLWSMVTSDRGCTRAVIRSSAEVQLVKLACQAILRGEATEVKWHKTYNGTGWTVADHKLALWSKLALDRATREAALRRATEAELDRLREDA